MFSHFIKVCVYLEIFLLIGKFIGLLGVSQAEARLAARRQARAEAREIRMKELERQQKEAEENADRVFDMCTGNKLIN